MHCWSFPPWQLLVAFLIDLAVGDPQGWPHPVRWIGAWIDYLEGRLYREDRAPLRQRLAGAMLWLAVVAGVLVSTWILAEVAARIDDRLQAALLIWMAYSTLAARSLQKESARVIRHLEAGNLERARQALAFIVSRDTEDLNQQDVVRAVLETVAENSADGIVAPLFYLALGGPVAAMVYKAVNTMDSMLGYRNDRYLYFGWAAARADDLANWIPARLTGILFVFSARLTGSDWRRTWRTLRRDARKLSSPNAGYGEAAAAGLLGVQLGGGGVYFGRRVDKPKLGDPVAMLDTDCYRRLIRAMYGVSWSMLALALLGRALLYYG